MNMIFDFFKFTGRTVEVVNTKKQYLCKKNEGNILETYSLTTLLKINKIWNEKIMRFSPMLCCDTILETTMAKESRKS